MLEGIAVTLRPEQSTTNIFEYAPAPEYIGNLKAARETHSCNLVRWLVLYLLFLEAYVPGGNVVAPADEMEQRGFSGAIGPDDGVLFTFNYIERDTANDFRNTEVLFDVD